MITVTEITKVTKYYVGDVEVTTPLAIGNMLGITGNAVTDYLNKRLGAPKPYAVTYEKSRERTFWRIDEALPFIKAILEDREEQIARGEKVMGRPRK